MDKAKVQIELRHLTWRLMETYRVVGLAADKGRATLPYNMFLYYDARSMNN